MGLVGQGELSIPLYYSGFLGAIHDVEQLVFVLWRELGGERLQRRQK